MFNKRFVHFADGVEAAREQPKSGAEVARARLDALSPDNATELQGGDKAGAKAKEEMKSKDVHQSMEEEAQQTNENARADIISIIKEGNKLDPNVPPAGVDRKVFNDIVKDLKGKLPQGGQDHLTTHWESLTGGDQNFYFVSVFDKGSNPKVRFFFKKGEDFSIPSISKGEKTTLGQVDDETYKRLTGVEREQKKE
jgi:hypothetical protein